MTPEQIPTVILYFIAWAMYRIVLHDQKTEINDFIFIYAPKWIPRCQPCIWYNLGVLEGLVHLIFITTIL